MMMNHWMMMIFWSPSLWEMTRICKKVQYVDVWLVVVVVVVLNDDTCFLLDVLDVFVDSCENDHPHHNSILVQQ
jgi:hypothetical protein